MAFLPLMRAALHSSVSLPIAVITPVFTTYGVFAIVPVLIPAKIRPIAVH